MVVEREANVKSTHWGESSFGVQTRGQQYLTALRNSTKHQHNASVRHREDFHRGEEGKVKYRFKPVSFYNRAMAAICLVQMQNSKLDHCTACQQWEGSYSATQSTEEKESWLIQCSFFPRNPSLTGVSQD